MEKAILVPLSLPRITSFSEWPILKGHLAGNKECFQLLSLGFSISRIISGSVSQLDTHFYLSYSKVVLPSNYHLSLKISEQKKSHFQEKLVE